MNVDEQIKVVASKIYEMGRSKIMINCRFLANAINRNRIIEYPLTIATDGECIYMNPVHFIKQYKKHQNLTTRAVLHLAIHCVFMHMFVGEAVDKRLWDVACDVIVENAINELKLSCVDVGLTEKQNVVVAKLKNDLKEFTAEYVYKYFLYKDFDEKYISQLENLFCIDEHSVWYDFEGEKYKNPEDYDDGAYVVGETVIEESEDENSSQDQQDGDQNQQGDGQDGDQNQQGDGQDGDQNQQGEQGDGQQQGEGDGQDGDNGNSGKGNQNGKSGQNDNGENGDEDGQDGKGDNKGKGQKSSQNSNNVNGGNSGQGSGVSKHKTVQLEMLIRQKQGLQAEWKRVALQVKVDMETFSRAQGSEAGAFMQSLQAVTREQYSYEEFLKKFAVTTEEMKLNDDEFDYIFYTYGLKLYQNVPLIEPLEYRDEKRIKEFAIIIDTSGSVKGELVQRFLQKTYNILKEEDSFATKVCIHIIQCDTAIQHDTKIEKLEELEEYFKKMKLYGFGGTDFRPAFEYVDDLITKKEFTNLKGVLYFTDGYGTFPQKPPKYKTAFVFIEGNDNNYKEVPSWAIQLKLDKLDLV